MPVFIILLCIIVLIIVFRAIAVITVDNMREEVIENIVHLVNDMDKVNECKFIRLTKQITDIQEFLLSKSKKKVSVPKKKLHPKKK